MVFISNGFRVIAELEAPSSDPKSYSLANSNKFKVLKKFANIADSREEEEESGKERSL